MTVTALALTAAYGALVGIASGLLGIGGGVLVVPFLYLLFGSPWGGVVVPPASGAVVAHATSLLVVLPTALSGLLAYHRRGVVRWSVVLPMGAAAAVAAFLTARMAANLPAELLKTLFGTLLVAVAFRMWPRRGAPSRVRAPGEARRTLPVLLSCGALVGTFSALLGVGGGVVAIPLLVYWVRLDLAVVAATSIGIVAMGAPAGVAGYMLPGAVPPGLPEGMAGFVHLPSALAMMPAAVLAAPLGARLNQRMGRRPLAALFAVVFLLLGGRLVLSVWMG